MDFKSSYIIAGYVGNTPELRKTRSDVPVTSFNVAVHSHWTDDSGESHEQTIWHEVVCYRGRAEWVANTITEGDNVLVEGRPAARAYKDAEGIPVGVLQIIADKIQVTKKEKAPIEEPELA